MGFLSGEETNRGADDLRSILERARAMAGQAESNRQALEQMLGGVGRIMPPLADLNAKMRSFRVMATLIRIEGSRLNQAGVDFETLAEDVRKLASDIEENGKTILAGSLELRAIVRQAGSGLAEFEARQAVELPRIQAQAGTSLAALRERRGRASEASLEMASQYDAVRREIGEMVMSLQVHDITRQQVEHAAAALGQWDKEISVRSAALLVRVCGLQRAQLDHSKESFLAGVAARAGEPGRHLAECLPDGCRKHGRCWEATRGRKIRFWPRWNRASPGFARRWRSTRNRGTRSRWWRRRWRTVCGRCRSSWRRSKRSVCACSESP